jgi:hypothetical protein
MTIIAEWLCRDLDRSTSTGFPDARCPQTLNRNQEGECHVY